MSALVGYVPFEPPAAKLFFQGISGRYERASVIVNSNKPSGKAHTFRRTRARQRLNSTASQWRGTSRTRTYPAGCGRDVRAGRQPDQDTGRLLANHR
ncbi:ATP-binding protein [Streptomyces sp. 7R007]